MNRSYFTELENDPAGRWSSSVPPTPFRLCPLRRVQFNIVEYNTRSALKNEIYTRYHRPTIGRPASEIVCRGKSLYGLNRTKLRANETRDRVSDVFDRSIGRLWTPRYVCPRKAGQIFRSFRRRRSRVRELNPSIKLNHRDWCLRSGLYPSLEQDTLIE